MRICPFITQASILDDKELLVREIDDVEPAKQAKQEAPRADDDGLFINPRRKAHAEVSLLEEIAPVVSVRFLAKSYRGQVECLGELCRFHDEEAGACRVERLLSGPSGETLTEGGALASALAEIEESQKKNTDEMLERFKDFESKNESRITELRGGLERKLDELTELFRSSDGEKLKAIEAITLTLEAKTDEIERKIDSGEESFKSFREEVSNWNGTLSKNAGRLESELGEHRRLVEELSENHTGIMELVENQKKSIEEEEMKRRVSEARRLNNAGVMAYHNGQYEKALELFAKAIEVDPSMTEAYNNIGLTHTEMNDEEKATEAFKKAISLSPELSAAYNNLGYVFYRLGSYEEAIEMYNEAIGRSTNSSSAYTNLGNAYYKLEKVEEAIDSWKKALAIDPANEKARRNLKRFHAEVK